MAANIWKMIQEILLAAWNANLSAEKSQKTARMGYQKFITLILFFFSSKSVLQISLAKIFYIIQFKREQM